MKVYCFRMGKLNLKKGPPRPGLIPVRVFVSGGKVRAHTKLVYKKPGEDVPHELKYVGSDADKDKLHIVGSSESDRTYTAIVYIREEDLDKFLNPGEQKRLDARIHAEYLLANFGHTDRDLAQLTSDMSALKAELSEETAVAARTGEETTIAADKIRAAIVDLKASITSMKDHFIDELVEISPGRKRRRRRPKIGITDVDGLGHNISSAVMAKLNRRVEKISASIDTGAYLDNDDLRKIIDRLLSEDADRITQRGAMFGFMSEEDKTKPRMPTEDGAVGESFQDVKDRWVDTRGALKSTLIWHMKKTMAEMYPHTLGTAIDATDHPYTKEVKSVPTLPETARGAAFSLSRKVATGSLLIPVTRDIVVEKGKRRRVVNRADSRLFGHMGPSGKRYLTRSEYDTLISEMMGARIAIFDKHGKAIASAIDLPEGTIESKIAQKMWQGGFMDTIIPIVKTIMRNQGVTYDDFQRMMGAAMTGMMDALVSYGPDLGQKFESYTADPALALMTYVARTASDHAETEAYNIRGEREGSEYLAHLTIQQFTGGSFGKFKKIALVHAEAQRRLAARGVFEEPTTDDLMEAAETYMGQFAQFVPATVRDKDPEAVRKWFKDQVTRGLELDHFSEESQGDEDSEGAENAPRMSVGKMFSEARQWYNLMYRGGPRTMGQIGAASVDIRTYERDKYGNIVHGFRDHGTGRITPDPQGHPILREEWIRNNDGTFKKEPLRDDQGEIVRIDKRELSALDIYRDRYGSYRRKNGNVVTNPNPHSIKYEETNKGHLICLDHLVPNRRAHSHWAGGTIVSPLQMEKLEIAAHIRRELFSTLASPKVGEKYTLTAEDARIIDMVYFRGMALDPHQEYHDEHDELQQRQAKLAELKGMVDPIKIDDDTLMAHKPFIEVFTGKKAKVGMTVTNFEIAVGQALINMEREGASVSAIEGHKLKAENKLRDLRKQLRTATDKYNATQPQVFYPDAAPPSACTPGMLNFPGVPVNAEGSPNCAALEHLSSSIVSKLGKKGDYDVALHIALRRELADPKYGETTSVFRPEDLDNPDLRKAARIFFDTGELPADVVITRHPSGKHEYEERVAPRKHGLRTRIAKDGTAILERTKTRFLFAPGKPKRVAGESQPLVHDSTMVDDDGRIGKTVPMYSVLTDEKVLSALADVQRVKGLISKRGYFDKTNTAKQLPIVRKLQEDAPELFISGPPRGQSTMILEDELDAQGEIKYVVHKQEFTRKEVQRLSKRITELRERVNKALKKSEKRKQAEKALQEAEAKRIEVTEYLDWKAKVDAAWAQRKLSARHGIHDWPRDVRGEAGRSRRPEPPVFTEKQRRSLRSWVTALKSGGDPSGQELERWMSGYMERSPAQEKADRDQITILERQLARTGDPKQRKRLQGKVNVLTTRTFDAVKVHDALLTGMVHGSDFAEAYSHFLNELHIATDSVWDSHSILMFEADQAFKQAVAAKNVTDMVDPAGHHEVIASREMKHPQLRFLSTDHVLASIRAMHDNMTRNSARVASGRSEVRKVIHVLPSVQQAYQRDESGRILRDPKTKEPVLRDDVTTVDRERRGKLTKRGAVYQSQQANQPTQKYTEYYEEVSRVLPKTAVTRVKGQVVKITEPKYPNLPPSLRGHEAQLTLPGNPMGRRETPAMTGNVAEQVTLKPPSEIPREAPAQSMAHVVATKGFDKPPVEMGRVLPPVKTEKSLTGAVAVPVWKPSSSDIKPVDSVISGAKAREWSARIRIAPVTTPKYEKPRDDTPIHSEIPSTEAVSEKHDKFVAARQALVRELKAQHRMKTDGQPISRSRQALLDGLQQDYRDVLSTFRSSPQQRKIAGVPGYKDPKSKAYQGKTTAGRPKFAFSTTIYAFGDPIAPL